MITTANRFTRAGERILTSDQVLAYLQPEHPMDRHRLQCLTLTDDHRWIHTHLISIGGMPLEAVKSIWRYAVYDNAGGIILTRSSDHRAPDTSDRALIRDLQRISKPLGIELVDYIITSSEGLYSFDDHMELDPEDEFPF